MLYYGLLIAAFSRCSGAEQGIGVLLLLLSYVSMRVIISKIPKGLVFCSCETGFCSYIAMKYSVYFAVKWKTGF